MLNARHLRPSDLAGLRWRGYVRESTEEQTDRGTPPARQKADILRAVEELGMVGEPNWYERSGSGEKESAELQQALSDAGQYDVLVVFSTSRFARNRAEAVRMKAAFAKAGVIIYFASDRIISGARTSSLTEGIKEVVDSEENETRRFFIAGGLRERQLSGKWCGSIPFGYRKRMTDNADGSRSWDGTLAVDPGEAGVVRFIFSERVLGKSDVDTAHALAASGAMIRGRGVWRSTAVRQIASNPIYTGEMVRYRRHNPNHYFPEDDPRDGRLSVAQVPTAILDPGLWEAGNQPRAPRRPSGQPYPLSRVLRCPKCDSTMTGCHAKHRYYRCYARTVSRTCDAPYVAAEPVEEAFADWLARIHLPADWREAIARQRSPKVEPGAERLRAYLTRIKRLYAAGDMEWEEYQAERAKTRELLAAKTPPDMGSIEALAAILEDLGPLWRSDRQPSLPQHLIERAVPRGRSLEVEVKASLRPLLSVCLPATAHLYSGGGRYTVAVRYV